MVGFSEGSIATTEPEFRELSLLLPTWQLHALDDLARSRGLNIGQLLRKLIGNMLQEIADQGP